MTNVELKAESRKRKAGGGSFLVPWPPGPLYFLTREFAHL